MNRCAYCDRQGQVSHVTEREAFGTGARKTVLVGPTTATVRHCQPCGHTWVVVTERTP